MKWISIEDSLPDKNDGYLVAYNCPGHGRIVYYRVINFQAIAYETPVNRWGDASVSPYITHWQEIETPEGMR